MPRSFAPFMGPFTWRECSKIKWESGNVAREGQLICLKGVVTRQNKNRCLTLAMAKHHVAPKKLVQSHPKRFFLGWNIHKKPVAPQSCYCPTSPRSKPRFWNQFVRLCFQRPNVWTNPSKANRKSTDLDCLLKINLMDLSIPSYKYHVYTVYTCIPYPYQ